MNRNIGRSSCDCGSPALVFDGPPHPITEAEANGYYSDYVGLTVRDAHCPLCLAQYLAWLRPWTSTYASEQGVYDLSYRSSFDDDPGPSDAPVYRIEWQPRRVATTWDFRIYEGTPRPVEATK